jgi:hypothetical protein
MSGPDAEGSSVAVLAEKPSVARDIARVLGATKQGQGYLHGNGYVVTWAIGHLVALVRPHEIQPEWKHWRRDLLPTAQEAAFSPGGPAIVGGQFTRMPISRELGWAEEARPAPKPFGVRRIFPLQMSGTFRPASPQASLHVKRMRSSCIWRPQCPMSALTESQSLVCDPRCSGSATMRTGGYRRLSRNR